MAGLSAGAVLIAAVVLVAPVGALPIDTALGVPLAAAPATTAPPTTTARRTTVPRPVLAPPTTAPTTTPAPTTTVEPTPEPEPTTAAPRRAAGGPAAQVVELTNAERADAGCDPLVTDPRLAAAAQGHAEDMSAGGYFDHVSRDGRRFDDRIGAQGYPSPGGENIARGQETAAEVVQGWMDSPGHRRNIENCDFTAIGVGFADDGNYWVQNFGF
ncbi:CAP domain-containing protein [Pseudonocardia abyssalis]|uniref:CAP domain-containing protein n=1 Tax=Pseudonocardia abyssalis TaxID=2792008 RepID=A0ABS6UKG4_9PSEU|nr:CAP domain-containing protein [Pseudonocardia abyssalis]